MLIALLQQHVCAGCTPAGGAPRSLPHPGLVVRDPSSAASMHTTLQQEAQAHVPQHHKRRPCSHQGHRNSARAGEYTAVPHTTTSQEERQQEHAQAHAHHSRRRQLLALRCRLLLLLQHLPPCVLQDAGQKRPPHLLLLLLLVLQIRHACRFC